MSTTVEHGPGVKANAGVILLEVLLAITLFSVGVVAVLGALRVSQSAVTRSENLLEASWTLQEVISEWAENPGAESRGVRGRFEYAVETTRWTSPRGDEGRDDPVPGGVELARVTVTWEERGQKRSVEASELIARESGGGAP